ncbi:hypothetical protein [Endozoicomonas sp. Mp262]|uniref:hypothetical protein n=1 Tax=Endozoicomonas sp. Mp262 TaxID=2919499 RepID=UPI0021DA5A19
MGIDAEQLDKEADKEYAQMMGTDTPAPAPQDKQAQAPAADELPQPVEAAQPESSDDDALPAPDAVTDDWQDKYTKAEESRKNAHALMTKATQEAAELRRSNDQLQQQLAGIQAQLDQLQQQPPAAATPPATDRFSDLREDYEELNPVFETVEQTAAQHRALQQRLDAIEKQRQEEAASQRQEAFWAEVRKHHPDVDQVAQSDDFKGWFARQATEVQQLSQTNPLGAATVMDMYKKATGQPSPAPAAPSKIQQAQRLSEPQVRSRSQPTTQGRQPALTPDQIAALSQKDYEANETEYDKQLSQWLKQGGR